MITDNFLTCANCGKGEEESGSLKLCTACKLVKYCSRDCQKAHRSQHKKECRKRANELHDEDLFRQPPQAEECPICFLLLPSLPTGRNYMTCCGKFICCGCIHAGAMVGNDKLCPFCRAPAPSSDNEAIERVMKRVDMGDSKGMNCLGWNYSEEMYGLTQDWGKSLKLWLRAGELGCADGYYNVGSVYFNGLGVERDGKKAMHYYELAAMGGDISGRHNLGSAEANLGNYDRALKHFLIAVGAGGHDSLTMVHRMHTNGHATRDDYAKALKAYQAYLREIKSDDRDTAAASEELYKYYE